MIATTSITAKVTRYWPSLTTKVKRGGTKGNITLPTYDGAFKLQIATAENVMFDERLQAAKTLIDECINEWAKGSRPEIMVLVQQAFQTDKEGNLNVGRILALRRLEIADERWKAAMTRSARRLRA